jgi:hypothetical protein
MACVCRGRICIFAFGRSRCGMGHGKHDQRRQPESDLYDSSSELNVTPISTTPARLWSEDIAAQPNGYLYSTAQPMEGALTTHAGHESASGLSGLHRTSHGCRACSLRTSTPKTYSAITNCAPARRVWKQPTQACGERLAAPLGCVRLVGHRSDDSVSFGETPDRGCIANPRHHRESTTVVSVNGCPAL